MACRLHHRPDRVGGGDGAETTTYGNGFWYATGLPTGQYTVNAELSDFYFTAGAQAGSLGGTVLSDTAIGGIAYSAGLTSTGYDIGFWYGGYLFGSAWNDLNGDGARTLDESLLGGLPMTLTGVSVRGDSVSLTTTSAPGSDLQQRQLSVLGHPAWRLHRHGCPSAGPAGWPGLCGKPGRRGERQPDRRHRFPDGRHRRRLQLLGGPGRCCAGGCFTTRT